MTDSAVPSQVLRPVPEVTAGQENYRLERLAPGVVTPRRDPVEPVPVGTYIVKCFRVTGYDRDCDGSLLARLEAVDRDGKATGWEPTHLGLYPDVALVVDDPALLWLQEGTRNPPARASGRTGCAADPEGEAR